MKLERELTPYERELLKGVSIPDLALGGAAPIKLLQTNSPQLLDSPENSFYLPGSMAGGYSVPSREGSVFLPVPPGFHGGPFALARDYIELEVRLNTTGELEQIGEPYAEMPKDAAWARDPVTGKKVCKNAKGNVIRERLHAFMKIEETGQLGCLTFAKTALRVGRGFRDSSQRLSVEGLDGIKGVVLGRYHWTSHLVKEGDRRWYAPVWQLVGKLGQPGGPSLASVLELAELRKAFMSGLRPALELEGPPDPPAPSLDEPLDGPPEPPPYERNPDDDVDDIDFGP